MEGFEEMKKLLLEMRGKLIDGLKDQMQKETDHKDVEIGDDYDFANKERDRELSLLLSSRDRGKLTQIDNSLKRIEDGTYGICEECEEQISLARLKVMPFARLCVSCQEEEERRSSHGPVIDSGETVFRQKLPPMPSDDEM